MDINIDDLYYFYMDVEGKVRGLLYSWCYADPSSCGELFDALIAVENGQKDHTMVVNMYVTAICAGTLPTVSLFTPYILGMLPMMRSPENLMSVTAVANLVHFGIYLDVWMLGISRILSAVTRSTLVFCRHFVGENMIHEYLRVINYQLDAITVDHPFAIPALIYWGLREIHRKMTRWDVTRDTPYPMLGKYLEDTINNILLYGHDLVVMRVVLSILSGWCGIDSVPPPGIETVSRDGISSVVEQHALWCSILIGRLC